MKANLRAGKCWWNNLFESTLYVKQFGDCLKARSSGTRDRTIRA